jgi:hypothetical protein
MILQTASRNSRPSRDDLSVMYAAEARDEPRYRTEHLEVTSPEARLDVEETLWQSIRRPSGLGLGDSHSQTRG